MAGVGTAVHVARERFPYIRKLSGNYPEIRKPCGSHPEATWYGKGSRTSGNYPEIRKPSSEVSSAKCQTLTAGAANRLEITCCFNASTSDISQKQCQTSFG